MINPVATDTPPAPCSRLTRRLMHLTGVILLCATSLALGKDHVDLYPSGPLNPRIPNILPQPEKPLGYVAPFDTTFSYALSPAVRFPAGGKLSLWVRDNLQRAEKNILTLDGEGLSLSLRISPASQDRNFSLQLLIGKQLAATLPLKRPLEGQWTQIQLQWDQKTITLIQDGKPAGSTPIPPLPHPFSPRVISLHSWNVTNLELSGDGQFSLDWKDGYAAQAEIGQSASGVNARLLGFDSYVISLNPHKRDYPLLQLINSEPTPRTVTMHFQLHSEINGIAQSWQQVVAIPARTQILQPIQFPLPLVTDIYHLDTQADGGLLQQSNHFMYIQRRDEPAGPMKFGLHDSGAKAFGYWPDALPIDVAHVYANWAYIQGPPWIKDFHGDWGMDPKLPPQQWNWSPKLDWVVLEGHHPYVCLGSVPFQDWQRRKLYPESMMQKYGWGWRGGAPDDAAYRHFLQAFLTRYQGKIWAYEIENEPNTPHGFLPEDYAQVAQDVYEEVKAKEPQTPVYGICGTSLFTDWMSKVFAVGGAKYMDGVSWHTYVTPASPEEARLDSLLADARKVIDSTGRKMPVLNSETGTYVAPREQVDRPIPEDRLQKLIADGVQPLAVPKGWPSRALSESAGSISVVTNALTNFLAGAECFIFFGWNPDWPKTPQWWNVPFDDSNFSMLSVARDGQHTPSLFTLAVGVLTAQMEPADHRHGVAIFDYLLRGAIFPKKTGRLAILWSARGPQTVLVQTSRPELELVSLFGQPSRSQGTLISPGTYLHYLLVSEEPLYVHDSSPDLLILPSLIQAAKVNPGPLGKTHLILTLRNPLSVPWRGSLQLQSDNRWDLPAESPVFSLEPGKQSDISCDIQAKAGLPKGHYPLTATFPFPDGKPCLVSADISVSPSFNIPLLPTGMSLADMRNWEMLGGPLQLNRPEQVVVGRPPAMVSLQEKQYWSGPDELSASVKLGCDPQFLSIYVEVRDSHAKLPATWPGVNGTCLEFFLDCRPLNQGLGNSRYDRNVHQLVIKPALAKGQTMAVWKASAPSADLPGKQVAGGPLAPDRYWVALRIPWRDLGLTFSPGQAIGFDLGVDGADETGSKRKSQLMLFGSAANNRDASRFGLGFLPASPK